MCYSYILEYTHVISNGIKLSSRDKSSKTIAVCGLLIVINLILSITWYSLNYNQFHDNYWYCGIDEVVFLKDYGSCSITNNPGAYDEVSFWLPYLLALYTQFFSGYKFSMNTIDKQFSFIFLTRYIYNGFVGTNVGNGLLVNTNPKILEILNIISLIFIFLLFLINLKEKSPKIWLTIIILISLNVSYLLYLFSTKVSNSDDNFVNLLFSRPGSKRETLLVYAPIMTQIFVLLTRFIWKTNLSLFTLSSREVSVTEDGLDLIINQPMPNESTYLLTKDPQEEDVKMSGESPPPKQPRLPPTPTKAHEVSSAYANIDSRRNCISKYLILYDDLRNDIFNADHILDFEKSLRVIVGYR